MENTLKKQTKWASSFVLVLLFLISISIIAPKAKAIWYARVSFVTGQGYSYTGETYFSFTFENDKTKVKIKEAAPHYVPPKVTVHDKNYECIGWKIEPLNKTVSNSTMANLTFNPQENNGLYVYPVIVRRRPTITFMDDKSVLFTKKITYDSVLNRPNAPYKKGSVFVNWYVDKGLTKAYSFNTKLTSNLRLYAKFIPATIPFVGEQKTKTVNLNEVFILTPDGQKLNGDKGWTWDKKYFEASFSNAGNFKALKMGKTKIEYKNKEGQKAIIKVVIDDKAVAANPTGGGVQLEGESVEPPGSNLEFPPILSFTVIGFLLALAVVVVWVATKKINQQEEIHFLKPRGTQKKDVAFSSNLQENAAVLYGQAQPAVKKSLFRPFKEITAQTDKTPALVKNQKNSFANEPVSSGGFSVSAPKAQVASVTPIVATTVAVPTTPVAKPIVPHSLQPVNVGETVNPIVPKRMTVKPKVEAGTTEMSTQYIQDVIDSVLEDEKENDFMTHISKGKAAKIKQHQSLNNEVESKKSEILRSNTSNAKFYSNMGNTTVARSVTSPQANRVVNSQVQIGQLIDFQLKDLEKNKSNGMSVQTPKAVLKDDSVQNEDWQVKARQVTQSRKSKLKLPSARQNQNEGVGLEETVKSLMRREEETLRQLKESEFPREKETAFPSFHSLSRTFEKENTQLNQETVYSGIDMFNDSQHPEFLNKNQLNTNLKKNKNKKKKGKKRKR